MVIEALDKARVCSNFGARFVEKGGLVENLSNLIRTHSKHTPLYPAHSDTIIRVVYANSINVTQVPVTQSSVDSDATFALPTAQPWKTPPIQQIIRP